MIKRLPLIVVLLLLGKLMFAQVKVTFVTAQVAPFKTAKKVIYLAGDFNNWDPSDARWQMQPADDGSYKLSKIMTATKYSFKVTKGSWPAVECAAGGGD